MHKHEHTRLHVYTHTNGQWKYRTVYDICELISKQCCALRKQFNYSMLLINRHSCANNTLHCVTHAHASLVSVFLLSSTLWYTSMYELQVHVHINSCLLSSTRKSIHATRSQRCACSALKQRQRINAITCLPGFCRWLFDRIWARRPSLSPRSPSQSPPPAPPLWRQPPPPPPPLALRLSWACQASTPMRRRRRRFDNKARRICAMLRRVVIQRRRWWGLSRGRRTSGGPRDTPPPGRWSSSCRSPCSRHTHAPAAVDARSLNNAHSRLRIMCQHSPRTY